MSADFTSYDICLTSVTSPICGPVHCVQSNHIKQVRGSLLSGLGIKFQNLNLLHFDQIIGLKSLLNYLFLPAWLNLGLQINRLPVQASQKAQCSERERERERERRLFKRCPNLPARHCYAGCMLFKRCRNLPADSVLHVCKLFKRCRNLPAGPCVAGLQAVSVVVEPTCRAMCYSGAGYLSSVGTYLPGPVLQGCRLFQWCWNLPAGQCVAWVQAV